MRFWGRCWRGHDPQWSFSPTSGEGARKVGGRFNRPGTPAIYLATALDTAIGECAQGFGNRIPPLTLCEYDVDCEPVADLTSDAARKAEGVALADLACPWKSLMLKNKPVASWLVADRLAAKGCAGMLVPSFFVGAQPRHVNLVLWNWGDELPAMVRVYDPEAKLPKDRASWT